MLYRCIPVAVYHAADLHDVLLADPFAGCQQAVCFKQLHAEAWCTGNDT